MFKFFTGGSLVIYLCHDLWINGIASYVILPILPENNADAKDEEYPFGLFLTVMIIGTEFMSNLTYFLLQLLVSACSKKSGPKK